MAGITGANVHVAQYAAVAIRAGGALMKSLSSAARRGLI